MGLFAKAAGATKVEKTKPRKSTTWVVGSSPEELAVGAAVHQLKELTAQAKAIDAKMELHKTVVKKHAERNFIKDYAELGVPPETPMEVQNADGEKCTYVVQDRSGQIALKADQVELLSEMLGEDAAKSLIFEETSFSLNRTVLAVPGVMPVIEKALESAIAELTKGKKPVLSEEVAGELISASTKTALKPGVLDRVAEICGRDTTRMKQFLDAVGSICTRYVRS